MDITSQKSAEEASGRYCGILAHPTSFPSPYGIGDLGKGAFDFIDFLKKSGQSLWQLLPTGPTGFGNSPYQLFSAFAGQPLLISPDRLRESDLLKKDDFLDIPYFPRDSVDYGAVIKFKTKLLRKAFRNFQKMNNADLCAEYDVFCEKNSFWLEDYTLFMAAKEAHNGIEWLSWEDNLALLSPSGKAAWKARLASETDYHAFVQFIFYKQWFELKEYANSNGIRIIGDVPIFAALDSADVWACRELFNLDSKGFPVSVAGVPPDYFSTTGQLWGNPLYDWDFHRNDCYSWWISRVRHQLELYDFVRIDHFRGFEAYWSIPFGSTTAENGHWVKGPGKELFLALEKELGRNLPIIAEDLGVITPEVDDLRDSFHFPGMKVLQFAFSDGRDNTLMPHYFKSNCVCYTGTHDNDTTLGWYGVLDTRTQDWVRRYMNTGGSLINWAFIRTALGSVAKYAIIPLQDVLSLGSESRMNTPGTRDGNWVWRYYQKDLSAELASHMKQLTELYGRHPETSVWHEQSGFATLNSPAPHS